MVGTRAGESAGAVTTRRRSRTVRTPLVLFTGGGTVGHLAPGFALASALERRGALARFATPGEAVEATWFSPGAPARFVLAAPRKPRRLRDALLFVPRLLDAVYCALRLAQRLRPAAVVGLGGWPCVPGSAAALLSGVPLALIASDTTPGLVVRLLTPFARRVYAAQEACRLRLARGRPAERSPRLRTTGPLVRPEVREARRDPALLGLSDDRRTLFVVGGSRGAEGLNRALAAGLSQAAVADRNLARQIQVLHSVGLAGEGVAEAYRAVGLAHRVVPFVREIGTAYRTADLVVSRAGALTCAELESTGTPAVLVPYPHHADRQQFKNAEPLAARGGALLLEEQALTPAAVREVVLRLLNDPPRLAEMSRRMASGARDTTAWVAADLLSLRAAPRPR
jgi:UDP-N-acetylglucosamine--N-acetylmuramyl-(pentapeptide) pyrophosphoryl-undecaprenol N-acetylglucosamine transferase